eukprot:Gb_05467 [translate_table: standard]
MPQEGTYALVASQFGSVASPTFGLMYNREGVSTFILIYGVRGANHGTLRWKEWDDAHNSRSILYVNCVKQGQWRSLHAKPTKSQKLWKLTKIISVMGDEHITTEPVVLVVDEEVRNILEEAGFLAFFKIFEGHSEGITKQFVDTWKDGRVVVDKTEILVNAGLIAEVSGLPNEGEVISREKMNQVSQLTKFIEEKETFCWLDSGIVRESLSKPWDRTGKGKSPLHQGLMKMIADFISSKNSPTAGPSKGSFTRVSGTPITKAQLLLEPISTASHMDTGDSTLEEDGDSESQEKESPRKLVGKPSLLDVADTSEEERNFEEPNPPGGKNSPLKGPAAAPSKKVESPGGPLLFTEELRCHLRVLNSLGSSLSSTCACVNLLTIEITNYLKEVLKLMKEKNLEKEYLLVFSFCPFGKLCCVNMFLFRLLL